MNIIPEFPPNIDRIKKIFPITGKEIFSWGATIYNPSNQIITRELLAHEKTHAIQQGNDIEGWWDRYLIDPKFRFEQELEAHQKEYARHLVLEPNRNRRRIYLKEISKRLASPMYGSMTKYTVARRLIKAS
jgi:hypothetical protein